MKVKPNDEKNNENDYLFNARARFLINLFAKQQLGRDSIRKLDDVFSK